MSFRLFIYYSALCGGWAALVGWVLGRAVAGEGVLAQAAVKGMLLGLLVALGLGLVDALGNTAGRRPGLVAGRALVAGLGGAVAGVIGGTIGQALYGASNLAAFLIFGWSLTGLLVGASLGLFDLLARVARREDRRGAWRKLVNGLVGGTAGGLVGGVLFLALKTGWASVFSGHSADELWSPSATGFVILGGCIGLTIGLAQVILKEAWVRIEKGFRQGRELILSKPETLLGRGEDCDIGLFGDPAVERTHARILRRGDSHVLADADTPAGTFLNGQRVRQPALLHSGDAIGVGNSLLRFGERQKQR